MDRGPPGQVPRSWQALTCAPYLPCSLPPDVRRYELILAKSAKQYAMCPLIDFINHSSSVEVTGQWPL